MALSVQSDIVNRQSTIALTHLRLVTGHLERIASAVFVEGKDLAHEKMERVGLILFSCMARLENRMASRDSSDSGIIGRGGKAWKS